jgi:GH25 family lysozyme M1 (1,4-beta-N-acetylmuramidase)
LPGFDVSHFDGKINWSQVPKTMKFVIAKSTDGTSGDDHFAINRNGAHSIELPFAMYHFVRPRHTVSSQMSNISTVVRTFIPGDLRVLALDLEIPEDDKTAWNALAVNDRTPYVDAFIDAFLQAFGVLPVLYMDQSFWEDVLGGINGNLGRCDLWLAAPGARNPVTPRPWKSVGPKFVQTSFTGKVAGVPVKAVDLDVFLDSQADLEQRLVSAAVA